MNNIPCPFNCYNSEKQLPSIMEFIKYTSTERVYVCKECDYKIGAFKIYN